MLSYATVTKTIIENRTLHNITVPTFCAVDKYVVTECAESVELDRDNSFQLFLHFVCFLDLY